ncbi:Hypothetical protein A7982_11518 [Minicystis rosea]|nr:Hypothetical protein A7982_11518 [Minicystis rosea]
MAEAAMKSWLPGLAALAAASIGCTPAGLWGNEARYAPDTRGYVVRHKPDSAAMLVLWDPLTGKKLRCREELDRHFLPVAREKATVLSDERTAMTTTMPVSLPIIPLTAGGVLLNMLGAGIQSPAEGLHWLLSSPSADTTYERGKRAFDMHHDAEAKRLFELARLKSGGNFDTHRSTYFLGLLYEREGRRDDAARAYRTFIERAIVRDEKAFDDAEQRLLAIEPSALSPCQSQTAFAFTWPAPRK